MKSPVGSKKQMDRVELQEGLVAFRCQESGGHYIPAISYMRWLSLQPARKPHLPPNEGEQQIIQTESRAYLCPETATIMTRYKVGHGFKFSIDRSITGGVWFDAGEWEALRSRNFHDEIHFVFTDSWQRDVLRNDSLISRRERLEERIGTELFHRIEALKTEVKDHPNRDEIIAFFIND